jgi:hypothetical protein
MPSDSGNVELIAKLSGTTAEEVRRVRAA